MRFIYFLVLVTVFVAGSFGQERGLEFLSNIPEFRDLSLKMSEERLKAHIDKHRLYARRELQKERVNYWVLTPAGENILVGFESAKCTGIQRMQPIPQERIKDEIGASEYKAWMAKPKIELPDGANRSNPSLLVASADTGDEVDKNLAKQISDIIAECKKITVGMTRAELLKTFTIEGGISTASHRTFVHRRCPYIKVDVDFLLSDPKQSVVDERPTDTVGKLSKPYLEWSNID